MPPFSSIFRDGQLIGFTSGRELLLSEPWSINQDPEGKNLRKPLDLLGSASRTSSLRNKRPSTQTKSIDPRAQPLLPHTRKQDDVSALVAMFLVDVSLPWHKTDAESHVDIFLSTSQKRSKTHVVTKSLYIMTWFVCLNNFECVKNVETFQTPKRVPWCLPQICWQR